MNKITRSLHWTCLSAETLLSLHSHAAIVLKTRLTSAVVEMIPFTLIAALLLLAGAGCTSVSSSGNDEAKVVARILARTAPPALVFQDRAGAQELLSSLNTSEYFDFGVILDAQKQIFASYFRPDQTSEKERFLARVAQSAPSDQSETFMVDHGVAIAIVRMETRGQTLGYVAVGGKRH